MGLGLGQFRAPAWYFTLGTFLVWTAHDRNAAVYILFVMVPLRLWVMVWVPFCQRAKNRLVIVIEPIMRVWVWNHLMGFAVHAVREFFIYSVHILIF
jgi:hypothetical protein